MLSFKKGILVPAVQAGLLAVLTTLLAACGEQPAPVDTDAAARVAATSVDTNDDVNAADLPVIVVTASRKRKSET